MIRIAIIEDVSAIRRSLTTFLNTESGCEVVASCESVEEFLALDASAIQVNVILSDIGLPGMNGIEGIKLFKKLYPDAEIIMLTGHGSVASGVEAMKLGAGDFLQKPVELADLLSKIGEARDKRMLVLQKRSQEELRKILQAKSW